MKGKKPDQQKCHLFSEGACLPMVASRKPEKRVLEVEGSPGVSTRLFFGLGFDIDGCPWRPYMANRQALGFRLPSTFLQYHCDTNPVPNFFLLLSFCISQKAVARVNLWTYFSIYLRCNNLIIAKLDAAGSLGFRLSM